PSQRKAVSGVVDTTVSLIGPSVPGATRTPEDEVTTPGVPIETPLASQTRNFTGIVLPCLNTLEPSVLTGWRTVCPAPPAQVPDEAYRTLSVPSTKLIV